MNVGDYIKHLRTERKMSQEELGAKIGVKRAAVQKWESGRVQNLKRETILKLSELFEVSPSSFIDISAETITIGNRIRTLRRNMHISQDELAAISGISIRKLVACEHGEDLTIPKKSIEIMADILNVTPAYLMGWNNISKHEKSDDLTEVKIRFNSLEPEYNFSPTEKNIIDKIRHLNSSGVAKIINYIDDLAENPKYVNNNISDDITDELKQIATAPMSDTIKQK